MVMPDAPAKIAELEAAEAARAAAVDPEALEVEYHEATKEIGMKRVLSLERQMRDKLQTFIQGGPLENFNAFRFFDRGGNGSIDKGELTETLNRMGMTHTKDEATALFGRYDVRRCGEIDYTDFTANLLEPHYDSRATFGDKLTRMADSFDKMHSGYKGGGLAARKARAAAKEKEQSGLDPEEKVRARGRGPSRCLPASAPPNAPSPLPPSPSQAAIKRVKKAEARKVFEMIDKNMSGTLDVDELRILFMALGKQLTPAQIWKEMEGLDGDGSGELEFDEFFEWWDSM